MTRPRTRQQPRPELAEDDFHRGQVGDQHVGEVAAPLAEADGPGRPSRGGEQHQDQLCAGDGEEVRYPTWAVLLRLPTTVTS